MAAYWEIAAHGLRYVFFFFLFLFFFCISTLFSIYFRFKMKKRDMSDYDLIKHINSTYYYFG